MIRRLITGVGNVDPFTKVVYNVGNSFYESGVYLDGSMLNILRKYINSDNYIKDIYIYLTRDMNDLKDVYIKAIKHLYKEKSVSITFYPNDFYDDYVSRFRDKDVHKFSSYYKEINDIYSNIKGDNIEVIVNISSGTPDFKTDMMLMAVTNNLVIE